MKKLLLLLPILTLLVGCQQTPDNLIKLTGSILNQDESTLVVYVDRTPDTLNIAEDGTFVFEKESEKPISATLIYGRKRASLWLSPGKSLDLTVDVMDWSASLGFSGDLQSVNEYLVTKGNVQMGWGKDYMINFMKSADNFKASRDSVQNVFTSLLDDYQAKGMDKQFVEMEKLNLQYTMYGDLNNYPSAHKYYAKVENVELPDDWYDFTSSMDLNDPLLLEVDQAMYFISSWINTEAIKEGKLDEDSWGTPELMIAKFKFIDENIKIAEMQENFKFENIGQHLDGGPATGIEEVIESYLQSSTNEENKAAIVLKRDTWAPIAPGQSAPTWTLPDIDGKTMSLADFKGKYVYIDFWATWCGPCKVEIPFYRQLVKDYGDRNVVFVSISVDKDKPAWEKMVQEEKFEWMQLHDAVNMNDDYLVRYIPSFIFIDTEGKIIDPRAPRPSEQKLRDLLDSQENL